MMNFAELIASDIRLVILRILGEDGDYTLNEYVLQEALNLFGHKLSTDRLRTEISWLEEQGLLQVRDVAGIKVVKLTARGSDVAGGAATCPGVKRPRPE